MVENMEGRHLSERMKQIIDHVTEASSPLGEKLFEEMKEKSKVLKQKAGILNMMKDLLYIILSYPMIPEVEVDSFYIRQIFFYINREVRKLEGTFDPALNYNKLHWDEMMDLITQMLGNAERFLAKLALHMKVYLPPDMVKNMYELLKAYCTSANSTSTLLNTKLEPLFLSSKFEEARPDHMLPVPKAMYDLAVHNIIRQISKHIKEGTFKKIWVSGSRGEEVAKALTDSQDIRSTFVVVLYVLVSQHDTISKVESDIALQMHKLMPSRDMLTPYRFLMVLDCINEQIDLHNLEIDDYDGWVVLLTRSQKVQQIMEVNLEIRMEDYLLPWKLFCENVGQVTHSSDLQSLAVRLIKECHSHLLAIILLARALKDVTDVDAWELALEKLSLQPSFQVEGVNTVMVNVLEFIWLRKNITTKNCIRHCTLHKKGATFHKASLISSWIDNSLIETEREGEDIFQDLIGSFLLENVAEDSVQMREEIKDILSNLFIRHLHASCELTETPRDVEWGDWVIHLENNNLSELPKSPYCPNLLELFLQSNYELTMIPRLFFDHMPILQVLDLSHTSIKSLPLSVSKLVKLRNFYLRGCELLMELPPQIGSLTNLEVFDLTGTEIIYLPKEIGELINLKYLMVSFYERADCYKERKQIDTIIPRMALSKLIQLRKLRIDVNPDGEWWNIDVKAIINELTCLQNLETLELYLPTLELLQQFLELERSSGQSLISALFHFRLIIGRHDQHIMSCLPRELEEGFGKLDGCLKYINGEGVPVEITEVLKHAKAFFLGRHWTLKKLSEFGINKMEKLKFCLLAECNEIQTIIDEDEFYQEANGKKPILGSLEFLGIHCMENLESIWKGPIGSGCLFSLNSLTLHTCPSLTTIFTLGLLGTLVNLKKLLVEDCPKINGLVSLESSYEKSDHFLPSLEKISLLDLPELVNISNGLCIAPKLERMTIYNCPKLGSLSTTEVSSKDLRMIKGEHEWWDALKWPDPEWSTTQKDDLARKFVPLTSKDIMEQIPNEDFLEQIPNEDFLEQIPYEDFMGQIPYEDFMGQKPVDIIEQIPYEDFIEQIPNEDFMEQKPVKMKKKVVLKLDVNDKLKRKAMKIVSGLAGVDSVAMDMKEKKLTVIGDVDPVKVVTKLRKLCYASVLTIGPRNASK